MLGFLILAGGSWYLLGRLLNMFTLESDFEEFFLMLIDATGRKRDGLADGMIFCPSMSPFKIPTWERLLLLLDIFLFMASIRSF